MAHIAVLDDDAAFRSSVCALLAGKGHKASPYPTAGRFLDALQKRRHDLLIVDGDLPGMNGRELVRVLKRNPETKGLPVIILSAAQTRPEDMVRGLNDGADEYMAKPVNKELFAARVASLLRRSASPGGGAAEEDVLAVGDLRMGLSERTVSLGNGQPIELTRLEFDVLEYFLRNPGRVLTRGVLLQTVWKQPPGITTRTVDKHVESLRRKLGAFGRSLQTVVNVGYVFRHAAASKAAAKEQ